MSIYHAKVHQDNQIFMVKYFCNFCELYKNHRNFCHKNFLTVLWVQGLTVPNHKMIYIYKSLVFTVYMPLHTNVMYSSFMQTNQLNLSVLPTHSITLSCMYTRLSLLSNWMLPSWDISIWESAIVIKVVICLCS